MDNEKSRQNSPPQRIDDIPDRVPSPQADPLRDGTILFLSFCELLLRAEGLVGLVVWLEGQFSCWILREREHGRKGKWVLLLTGIVSRVGDVDEVVAVVHVDVGWFVGYEIPARLDWG